MTTQTDKVTLVTGSNKGIGLAIAEGLAKLGFHVVITSRTLSDAEKAATNIIASGGNASAIELDVTNSEMVDAAAGFVREKFGRLDVLVNNAGVALDQFIPASDVDIDLVRRTMEVNLYGAIDVTQKLLPLMKKQKHGRIVNISSELGSIGSMEMAGTLAYRTSKAALNAMTKLFALEVEVSEDILINAACPGWVKTELGGPDAPRSTQEGADTAIWLATLPAGGPNGALFRDRETYPW